MKIKLLICLVLLTFNSVAMATSYSQYRLKVKNQLVACLKDPENAKYSAAFNGCLLDAGDTFISQANIEYAKQFNATNAAGRSLLIRDRQIYSQAFNNCDSFSDLKFDGYTKTALCKIQVSKNYLGSLTNSAASLPSKWTMEDRIDKYFIGY